MIQFILNDRQVNTIASPGLTLLDFVRYSSMLTGTKIGCREGDCGACTLLVGEIINNVLSFRSVTSCLMPIANAHGKHIVTIEGVNMNLLNTIQQSMVDESATQCGFCTPGFVMSLTGFCLGNGNDVVGAIDGNICRCTGYKSIERAANSIAGILNSRGKTDPLIFAVERKFVPDYFLTIQKRLLELSTGNTDSKTKPLAGSEIIVGGGTDLYVQKHEEMIHATSKYLLSSVGKSIKIEGTDCVIGASATVTDLLESSLILKIFPEFIKYSKLVSSTPIRNMATIGGNFVNASPIGDLTVFFLALDARIILTNEETDREIYLRNFYKRYKSLDKNIDEYIKEIRFVIPEKGSLFNFEKVSKRTHLDIAGVNSAIAISVVDKITAVSISAGGVGPIPMYLKNTSDYLTGNYITINNVREACKIAAEEISPISDVRGSADYKRLLLQQLIKAHFITLFPDIIKPEKLLFHEEY